VVEVAAGSHSLHSITGREVKPGDRIIWERGVTCGQCYYCTVKHEPNLCPSRWAYGIHRSSAHPPHLVGCYADHMVLMPNTVVFHLDDYEGPSYPILASASCSGATAANAIEHAAVKPGDVVLVQGSGPLGLFATAFAAELGASEVITVGGSPESLELASDLGATLTLSYRNTTLDDRLEAARTLVPYGIDAVIETSGKSDSVNEGITLLRPGGAYLSAGFAIPGSTITLDAYTELVRKHLRLQGIWVSHSRHLHQALSLVVRKSEVFEGLIARTFDLEHATDALKAMESREVIKSAIVF
jgi:threonine dehydrogenase-like Zn-dependent dehydrogenase